MGRPATGCSTLCFCDFIRVPCPAARMMVASGRVVTGCQSYGRSEARSSAMFGLHILQQRAGGRPMANIHLDLVGFDLDGTLLDTSGDRAATVKYHQTQIGRPSLSAEARQNTKRE